MIDLGFDLSPSGAHTPLHAAAWRGQSAVIEVLLKAGADPKLRDPEHFSPPLGHALYGQRQEAIALLMQADMDIFLAAATGTGAQIDARLAEDPGWLNARMERVLPPSDKTCDIAWATSIWMAAMNGKWDMVQALAERGADLTPASPKGKTLAVLASQAGETELAARLAI